MTIYSGMDSTRSQLLLDVARAIPWVFHKFP